MATLISETLALEASGVSKRFGKVEALRDINLKVRQGEIFGLIGPDGAGKTTLFRLIASLLLPTAGQLRLCGIDVESGYRKVRRIIEKRVCQDYWNQRESGRDTARNRYAMKHRVSNHLRNIYGFVPTGFRYVA